MFNVWYKVLPVNSEVLVHLKNIEIPVHDVVSISLIYEWYMYRMWLTNWQFQLVNVENVLIFPQMSKKEPCLWGWHFLPNLSSPGRLNDDISLAQQVKTLAQVTIAYSLYNVTYDHEHCCSLTHGNLWLYCGWNVLLYF